jgi:hypothetical protein
MKNCWIFSADLKKYIKKFFIKNHPVVELLFHTDTQKEEWTDRRNDANSPFSQFFV